MGVGESVQGFTWLYAPSSGPPRPFPFVIEVSAVNVFDPDPSNNIAEDATYIVIPLTGLGEDDAFLEGLCFIATAAYGSYLDPHVQTLRHFRDDYLLTNVPGRAFVDWYYRTSPPIAKVIADHEGLRIITRALLTPVVLAVEYPAPTFALLMMLGFGLLRLARQRKHRRAEVAKAISVKRAAAS
jgi:hypothetical protein